jgi:hypothetical protein
MDTIRFKSVVIDPIDNLLDCEEVCAVTVINNIPLLDIVTEYESPFIGENAGGYEYQFADELYKYIYISDIDFLEDRRIGLLICGCLCEGCWPFYVRMESKGDQIIRCHL